MAEGASGQYRSAAMNNRLAIETFMHAPGALVDVRSPSEFAKAHWPGAVNLPLFDDEGRAEVGTLYKQQGRQQAIQRGLELVGPQLAAMGERLQQLADQQPGGLRIYCWRGGMRSGSVAWLASTLDLDVVVLEGGYKCFRRWVHSQFERAWPIQLLGGGTGSGKTDVLLALAQQGGAMVDLEGLAHHRGSSFGGLGQPEQPSTEMFENELAQALVAMAGKDPLWLEAESIQIGRCRLPNELWQQMQQAPVVVLQRPQQERIDALVALYGAEAHEGLLEATQRLQRRLGPQRTKDATDSIQAGDLSSACAVILDYYDRCYSYELNRRTTPITTLTVDGLSPGAVAQRLLQLNSA